MDERELQEFDLEDILKEFGDPEAQPEETPEEEVLAEAEAPEAEPEQAEPTWDTGATVNWNKDHTLQWENGDTIKWDAALVEEAAEKPADDMDQTIRLDMGDFPKGQTDHIQPVDEDEDIRLAEEKEEEAFSDQWEPEYEQPIAEYVAPQPIIFRPRSRLRELKRKLVAGPEKRYYELSEKGVGKLQMAIFLSLMVVLICAISTAMYAMGMVQENRMRLMVFGQFFAMLVSALLGSYQLLEGITDLFQKRFTLNTLLVFTFMVCCLDGILCLKQLRVPCCAAFSLQITMSLWSAYQKRNTQLGQLDTMRKATRLDGIVAVPDYYEGRAGFVKNEGQVEDFMDSYEAPSKPEKVLSTYAFVVLLVSFAVGIVGGILHGVAVGVQVTAVTLMAAVPATAFVALSRPMAVLERRLHSVGTVLCGWRGVEGLCQRAVFPLGHEDLFPTGTIKMNGVKFYSDREPDEVVAYATALICADGGGLAPLFTQLLDSRNGIHYEVENMRAYEGGGIGGEVEGEPVLVGTPSFLRSMGVEIPQGLRVSHAVCVAVDGELCGLFAVTYDKDRSSAAGLNTLCAYRKLRPVLITDDFMLSDSFLCSRFGIRPKRVLFPENEQRRSLREIEADENMPSLMMTTQEGLAAIAYGVTGARSLMSASKLGIVIHMIGGILGILMMLVLAIIGATELLTPGNLFLYELVWMIPGLIVTEWTRSI